MNKIIVFIILLMCGALIVFDQIEIEKRQAADAIRITDYQERIYYLETKIDQLEHAHKWARCS